MSILIIISLVLTIIFFKIVSTIPENEEDWQLKNDPNYLGQGRYK